MAGRTRWVMWTGGNSKVLHAQPNGRTTRMTVCGLEAQITGTYGISLPAGSYSHCGRCRSLLGE